MACLNHRKLAVSNEDEVIDALITWFKSNIQDLSDHELLQILTHVNWPYVQFYNLLNLWQTFPQLRQIPECKNIFNKEIQKRAVKSENIMSNPPRSNYKGVNIETRFNYKYYLDKISEQIIDSFDV